MDQPTVSAVEPKPNCLSVMCFGGVLDGQVTDIPADCISHGVFAMFTKEVEVLDGVFIRWDYVLHRAANLDTNGRWYFAYLAGELPTDEMVERSELIYDSVPMQW